MSRTSGPKPDPPTPAHTVRIRFPSLEAYTPEWYARRGRKYDPNSSPRERADYWWDELADFLMLVHGPAIGVRSNCCRRALAELAKAIIDAGLADRVNLLSDPDAVGGRTPAIALLQRTVLIWRKYPQNILNDARLDELRKSVIDGRTEQDHAARCSLAYELRDEVLRDPPVPLPKTNANLNSLVAELSDMVSLSRNLIGREEAERVARPEKEKLNELLSSLWSLTRSYPAGLLPKDAIESLTSLDSEMHALFADRWAGQSIPSWNGPRIQPTLARLDLIKRSWPPALSDEPPAGVDTSEGPTGSFDAAGLLAASDRAELKGLEQKIVKVIADRGGKVSIRDANIFCNGDAVSAFKRAKPKLRKRGWYLYQGDKHICAESLPAKGRK